MKNIQIINVLLSLSIISIAACGSSEKNSEYEKQAEEKATETVKQSHFSPSVNLDYPNQVYLAIRIFTHQTLVMHLHLVLGSHLLTHIALLAAK